MLVDRGTTGWADEPTASYRYYQGSERCAASCIVPPLGEGPGREWTFEVRNPNGTLLCSGAVETAGEPGRELARALCDAALGHEPLKGYRITRRENGQLTHTFVVARNGREAERKARQPGDVERAKRGDYRCEKLLQHELRAYYRGDFDRPIGGESNGH